MELTDFKLYKEVWMNSNNPHHSIKIDKHIADLLLSEGGYFNWESH